MEKNYTFFFSQINTHSKKKNKLNSERDAFSKEVNKEILLFVKEKAEMVNVNL